MLANFLLFQLCWFACVLGGAHEMPWLGPLFVTGAVAYHLYTSATPQREAILLGSAGLVGVLFDSAVTSAGLLVYPSGQWTEFVAPYWIVALWIAFATTFNRSLRWLRRRRFLAALCGLFGGPASYWAGAALGGVQIPEPTIAMITLGVGWCVILPTLMAVAAFLDGLPMPHWRPRVGCTIHQE